ncbi:MAG: hypothetical protein OWU84_05925 [Firmicutes bacterium]|nr:hypothetical protein [Bacillota bacterium]
MIVVMGKLMTLWSVFLLILELVDWFGVTKAGLRSLDTIAIGFTTALLLSSTLGTRWSIRYLERQKRHFHPDFVVREP